jgi:uracil-DNA glycosylase family 4
MVAPVSTVLQTSNTVLGPKCHDNGIRGAGNPNGRVVFLGIAPGKDEVRRTGRPFTGPSGELLDESLRAIGLSRDDYYATNLICWENNKPSPAEIAPCAARLEGELASIMPRLIVTMGQLVYETLTKTPFTRHRGVPEWSDAHECYILPTFHPSGVLHQGLLIHDFVRDLRKIPNILEWPDATALADVRYKVVQARGEAQRVLDQLPNKYSIGAPYVALDVETDPIQSMGEVQRDRETDEIDAFTDKLTCFSVSWGYDDTVVFPPHVLEDAGLVFPRDINWLFHYGISDVQVIARNTTPTQWLTIAEDTMLASYAIDERGGIHRLKTLAREYLGAAHYEDEVRALRKKGKPVPPDTMYEYNARDAAYTWRLRALLGLRMLEEDTIRLYRDILIPASNALAEIAYRGVHIDQSVLHRLFLEWAPRMQDQEDALVEMARSYGWNENPRINTNSSQQLSRLLFDVLGLPIIKRTPTGAASCDKETLGELALTGHPFITALQQLRRLRHIFNEYIIGILDDLKLDNRIHPVPLPHGTRTGRLSYHNPPIQTQPNEEVVGEEYGQVRHMFAAEDHDKYVIVGADYKQAEVWTAHYQSGDMQMLQDLQRDFHRYGASEVYQLPPEQITPAMRRNNKYVAFGIMYGRQAPALTKAELKNDPTVQALLMAGDTRGAIRVVERYIRRWLARYPEYDAWKERQKQLVLDEGELVTDAGRKRRFMLVLGEDAYHLLNAGINFKIQSLAHEVLLASLVELHHALKPLDSYILFEVHDALIMHVSKAHFHAAMQLIHDVMTRPRFGMGPLPVEFKVGKSWGEGGRWRLGDALPW